LSRQNLQKKQDHRTAMWGRGGGIRGEVQRLDKRYQKLGEENTSNGDRELE